MSIETAQPRRSMLEKAFWTATSVSLLASLALLGTKHYFGVSTHKDNTGKVNGIEFSGPFIPVSPTTLDMSNPAELTTALRKEASKNRWCTGSVITTGTDSKTSIDSAICANLDTLHVNGSGTVTVALGLQPIPANGVDVDLCGTFRKNPGSFHKIETELNKDFQITAKQALGIQAASVLIFSLIVSSDSPCVVADLAPAEISTGGTNG